MDLTSRVKSNSGETCTLIKVGEIINNSSHAKRRGKNRNRKVVWFNPPFCRIANINIGRYFQHLLDKHFNGNNPLSRIFNSNTVNKSYSFTKNMYNILSNRNRRLLNELITRDRNPYVGSCNCRNKEECPLGGKGRIPGMHFSYRAPKRRRKSLYRNLRGKLETKMNNHSHSFSNPKLIYQIPQSKYFGGLKDQGLSPQIKWKLSGTHLP